MFLLSTTFFLKIKGPEEKISNFGIEARELSLYSQQKLFPRITKKYAVQTSVMLECVTPFVHQLPLAPYP